MKKLQIEWIDDETDRLDSATQRAIENPINPYLKGKRAKLDLKKVKNENQITELISDIANKIKSDEVLPSLIVVDQRLDIQTKSGVTQRGSSLAVALRVQAPQVPLVGVSGGMENEFPLLQREQFIEFFSRDSISSSDRIPDLYAIAEGFKAIYILQCSTRKKPADLLSFLRLLKAPEEDSDLLLSCLPGRFKGVGDPETVHSLSRWIWHVLLGMPGFTYDDLEIATVLGLSREGFEKIYTHFSSCIYKGVFSSISRRRWWLSRVSTTARKLIKTHNSTPLWEIGRDLLGNKKKALFSKCYGNKSKDCVPDVVAFIDERFDPLRRVQALSSDTKLKDTDSPPPGFEPRRVLKRR